MIITLLIVNYKKKFLFCPTNNCTPPSYNLNMDNDYIEKMAREYAELLRAHSQKKTHSIVVPSEARADYFSHVKAQLRATAYLKSIVKIPVKKRVILAIEAELSSLLAEPYDAPKGHYKNAENAFSTLLDLELTKQKDLDSFVIDGADNTKKYLVLTLLSLLTF